MPASSAAVHCQTGVDEQRQQAQYLSDVGGHCAVVSDKHEIPDCQNRGHQPSSHRFPYREHVTAVGAHDPDFGDHLPRRLTSCCGHQDFIERSDQRERHGQANLVLSEKRRAGRRSASGQRPNGLDEQKVDDEHEHHIDNPRGEPVAAAGQHYGLTRVEPGGSMDAEHLPQLGGCRSRLLWIGQLLGDIRVGHVRSATLTGDRAGGWPSELGDQRPGGFVVPAPTVVAPDHRHTDSDRKQSPSERHDPPRRH